MPNQDSNHDEDTTSAEPLNRAERRARSRGKKPPVLPAGPAQPPGHHDQVLVPRRSGRRGNR